MYLYFGISSKQIYFNWNFFWVGSRTFGPAAGSNKTNQTFEMKNVVKLSNLNYRTNDSFEIFYLRDKPHYIDKNIS